jgi:hypothetical protein
MVIQISLTLRANISSDVQPISIWVWLKIVYPLCSTCRHRFFLLKWPEVGGIYRYIVAPIFRHTHMEDDQRRVKIRTANLFLSSTWRSNFSMWFMFFQMSTIMLMIVAVCNIIYRQYCIIHTHYHIHIQYI